jgi:ribose-phosphate pyrophosphokinase
VTHALLSGDAIARIRDSKIDVLVVTNTSPQEEHVANLGLTESRHASSGAGGPLGAYRNPPTHPSPLSQATDANGNGTAKPTNGGGKMVVIDVAPVFAEAIRRIHNGESVSLLFDHGI